MKFKKFEKSAKVLAIIAIANVLTGCGSNVISEGNFGLSKTYFTGTYDRDPIEKGFEFGLISGVHEYFGREEMIKIGDIHPKDRTGILLKELDLVVTFRVNKDKAVEFMVKTSDIEQIDGVYHLGRQWVERDSRNTIGKTIQKFESVEILNHPGKVENEFKKDLQADLDELYGKGTLIVESIKLSNVRVAEVVENKIQSIAVIEAEKAKNEATNKVLETREQTMIKEAQVIVNTANKSGLSVDQVLRYETIKAIREGASTQLQIPSENKTADAKPNSPKP